MLVVPAVAAAGLQPVIPANLQVPTLTRDAAHLFPIAFIRQADEHESNHLCY